LRIKKLHIKNYRSILDQAFEFDPLTVFLGPNGAGKSTVLQALNEFYRTSSSITEDDYYNRDTNLEIEISITFSELTQSEEELFSPYIDNNSLTITKIITTSGQTYHGTRSQNPDFTEVRNSSGKGNFLSAYRELKAQENYKELPSVRSADDAEAALKEWEATNTEQNKMMRDNGKFFGFRQVGQARLERFTKFVLIPAVRDAISDATDQRGSAIHELMDLVVRGELSKNDEYVNFKANVNQEYKELVDPDKLPQLGSLGERLTSNLRSYVPSASVILNWQDPEEISIPLPKANVRLDEDGFTAPVHRVGHGLQRAFIISLLQILVGIQSEQSSDNGIENTDAIPDLILGIEEPELYQHPNRQRHLKSILHRLSVGTIPGVAKRTQVLYATHSPLFVELKNFDRIRRIHKNKNPDNEKSPLVSVVKSGTMQEVANTLQQAQENNNGTPFTADGLQSRLVAVMTPFVNEGFFGDVAVLVEGEDDRAAILGCAQNMGKELEARGVSIIPCNGKTNLDKPHVIFSSLGIPTFVIFDSDSDTTKEREKHARTNKSLQHLLNINPIKDFPPTQVLVNCATFETNLDKYLRETICEEIYQYVTATFLEKYGYDNPNACKKSPDFINQLIRKANDESQKPIILCQIVDKLIDLIPHKSSFFTST